MVDGRILVVPNASVQHRTQCPVANSDTHAGRWKDKIYKTEPKIPNSIKIFLHSRTDRGDRHAYWFTTNKTRAANEKKNQNRLTEL